MNSSTPDSTRECFTDFAIQEYLMGRLDSDTRSQIEKHFHTCKECASCHNQYALERDFIETLLTTPSDTPPGLCVPDEMLARFLDNSLDEADRAKCESHLAVCSSCRRELLVMHDDVNRLTSSPEQAQNTPSPKPEGLILRMPERKPGSSAAQRIKWPIDEVGSA